MSLTGNVGRVAILEEEFLPAALNQRVACLRMKSDRVSKGYLYHFLNSDYFEQKCIQSSKGVAQKNMSTEWLKDFEIPVYTEEKQAEIVSVFDHLQGIIANRRQELQRFDDLIKARFVEMFGNREYPQLLISDLVERKVSTAKKDFSPDDTIKYIDISSIDNKRNLITSYSEYVLSEAPSRAQQHVVKGDILISTVRPNLRNIAITPYEDDNLVASSGFCVLRAKNCLASYLLAIACSNEFTDAMTKVVTGANYPAIKASDVMEYTVSLPPIELQNEFERFTEQVNKSKAAIQKALDEAQLLFDSLMQRYFG